MTDTITCILAVAVALLAVICLGLCLTIASKDDKLTRLTKENKDLKDVIEDMDWAMAHDAEVIRKLTEKCVDGEGRSAALME
jgi:hypothetical protein